MKHSNLPLIAIVGRPNVGKSALFNLAAGRRIAIVHEESGVTRDRIVTRITRFGPPFLLVDTGGLGVFENEARVELFDDLVRRQVLELIGEADRLIWVVDAQSGAAPLDRAICDLLHRTGRPVFVAVNKADNDRLAMAGLAEFAEFGFPALFPVSCTHRRGVRKLFTACVNGLPHVQEDVAPGGLRLAVIGRPNVGKSSLVNRLLGEERVLVTEVPGTTRDAVDVPFEIVDGETRIPATLVDTAGFRKKRQVNTAVELFSVMRAQNAVKRSDAVLLILDAPSSATALDRRIARLVAEAGKPCLVLANKWDLCADAGRQEAGFVRDLRHGLGFMGYAPVLCISARTGYNLDRLLDRVALLYRQMQTRVPTPVLNRFLADVIERTPPPARHGGKTFRVFYAAMTDSRPPQFLLFVNDPELCPAAYRQFLQRQIEQAFFPNSGLPAIVRLRPRHTSERAKLDGRRTAAAGIQHGKRREAAQRERRKQRHKRRTRK